LSLKSKKRFSLHEIASTQPFRGVLLLAGLFCILGSTSSVDGSVADKKWRFPVGLAYGSGLKDVGDAMEAAAPVDVTTWPVGLHFDPYYSLNDRFGVGGSLGPVVIMLGDLNAVIVPVGVDVRLNLLPGKSTSIYARGGVRYPIANGDLLGDGKAGAFGGIGVAIGRNRAVAWGLEASIDTSKVEVTTLSGFVTESVKPYEFMLSIIAEF